MYDVRPNNDCQTTEIKNYTHSFINTLDNSLTELSVV